MTPTAQHLSSAVRSPSTHLCSRVCYGGCAAAEASSLHGSPADGGPIHHELGTAHKVGLWRNRPQAPGPQKHVIDAQALSLLVPHVHVPELVHLAPPDLQGTADTLSAPAAGWDTAAVVLWRLRVFTGQRSQQRTRVVRQVVSNACMRQGDVAREHTLLHDKITSWLGGDSCQTWHHKQVQSRPVQAHAS